MGGDILLHEAEHEDGERGEDDVVEGEVEAAVEGLSGEVVEHCVEELPGEAGNILVEEVLHEDGDPAVVVIVVPVVVIVVPVVVIVVPVVVIVVPVVVIVVPVVVPVPVNQEDSLQMHELGEGEVSGSSSSFSFFSWDTQTHVSFLKYSL